jgi:hypothetical protein
MARQENSFYEYRDRTNRINANKRKMDEAGREIASYEAMDPQKRSNTDKGKYQFNKNKKRAAESLYNYDSTERTMAKQKIAGARQKALKELASSGTAGRLAQAGRTAQATAAKAKTAQAGVARGAQAMGAAMRRPAVPARPAAQAPRPVAQAPRPVARPAAQAQAQTISGAQAMAAAMRRR